jgi:hypothetical protein
LDGVTEGVTVFEELIDIDPVLDLVALLVGEFEGVLDGDTEGVRDLDGVTEGDLDGVKEGDRDLVGLTDGVRVPDGVIVELNEDPLDGVFV